MTKTGRSDELEKPMADESFHVAELLLEDFKCSHILMKLALEAQGRDSPDLVRAMSGLALGMGQGFNCGALSGGCCVLGLYAGRAGKDEDADPRFAAMLDDFTDWFHSDAKEHYGSIDCCDIMRFDPALKNERCPPLILKVWEKLEETLREYGIDPAEPPPAPRDSESA
jgi:C_GCAxxG_C_C family probable redox protein